MKVLTDTGALANKAMNTLATPRFSSFDPTSKLWKDYWARFCTIVSANAVPDEQWAQIFLTNQSINCWQTLYPSRRIWQKPMMKELQKKSGSQYSLMTMVPSCASLKSTASRPDEAKVASLW